MPAAGGNIKHPNSMDIEVGRRIRLSRKALGMSQTDLAKHLGLTFQQVQKYEKGANRIGAGRLVTIAEVLNTSVQFLTNQASKDEPWLSTLLVQPYALDMLKAFTSIEDKKVRAKLLNLATEIAYSQPTAAPTISSSRSILDPSRAR